MIAHLFGKRYELPVPLPLFIVSGAAVVFLSFLLVLPSRVPPRPPEEAAADRPAPSPRAPLRRAAAGLVAALLVAAGLLGSQNPGENILTTAVWVIAWIAVPVSCGVAGDWTRSLNPFASITLVADRPRLRGALLGGPPLPWPRWLGWWPAVALFAATACGELIYNGTATLPAVTAWALIVYGLLCAVASLLFGAGVWLERGELFSVLFSTWGRLGWFRFGAPGRRGPGGGLEVPFEASVSRMTFVLLLLVSVAFDGLLTTDAWRILRLHLPRAVSPGTRGYLALTTAAFALLLGAAWAVFGIFATAVRWAGRLEGSTRGVLRQLLPSLLPIAFGYLVAHNAQYLATAGQLLLPLAGDPAGLGWHALPYPFRSDYAIDPNLLPSSVVWWGQVSLIVAVHVGAVILAHRHLARAARDASLARRSEWPWVLAMVSYTMTSLWLLSQPIVQQGATS